jgi:hypothetical protein
VQALHSRPKAGVCAADGRECNAAQVACGFNHTALVLETTG